MDIYSPKVVRATMGSLFHLPVYDGVDIGFLMQLKQRGYCLFGGRADGYGGGLPHGFVPGQNGNYYWKRGKQGVSDEVLTVRQRSNYRLRAGRSRSMRRLRAHCCFTSGGVIIHKGSGMDGAGTVCKTACIFS